MDEQGRMQTWLAMKLGKSYNMVNGWVKNRRQPSIPVLFEIARLLGVKPSELIDDNFVG